MSDDVERARARLQRAESLKKFAENGLASGSTNSEELRVADAKYQAALLDLQQAEAAAGGTPPARSAPASNPTPEPPPPPPPQIERTTPVPVGESRETVLGGYDSEARAEATATRLIEREQSEARAQGREPANYEVVETTDDGFVIQKVTDAPATPAQTGFGGGRGSVVERPGERAAAAEPVPATPEDTGYSDPFAEGGDVADIGEETIVRSPSTTNDDPVVNEYDEFGDIERDLSRSPSTPTADPNQYAQLSQEQLSTQLNSTKAALDRLEALPADQRRQVQTQIDALQNQLDELDEETARRAANGEPVGPVRVENSAPGAVDAEQDPSAATVENTAASEDINIQTEAEREQQLLDQQANALLEQARNQATVAEQRKANGTAVGDGDWRVRLRLAPGATYLYKAPGDAGILEPLRATDGVIFPYTPRIDVAYRADYQGYDPTHSNYRHYFYKGSRVEFLTVTADFTAQDTQEAEYLLAVIHFLKSATKMFYGQDPERGSPPPLLYLTGLGEFQFNEHPCVIQEFNYNLPNDVDYIRARSRQISGADTLQYQRPLSASTAPSYSLSAIWDRLRGSDLPSGATPTVPAPLNLGLGNPTYVPTKITFTFTLLPVQSRRQVSQLFSLKEYANGNLLKGGMW